MSLYLSTWALLKTLLSFTQGFSPVEKHTAFVQTPG